MGVSKNEFVLKVTDHYLAHCDTILCSLDVKDKVIYVIDLVPSYQVHTYYYPHRKGIPYFPINNNMEASLMEILKMVSRRGSFCESGPCVKFRFERHSSPSRFFSLMSPPAIQCYCPSRWITTPPSSWDSHGDWDRVHGLFDREFNSVSQLSEKLNQFCLPNIRVIFRIWCHDYEDGRRIITPNIFWGHFT